ncbi:MAG: nucleotide exchange factor GrpE [Mycoplasmatales bacterium]
MTKKAKKDDSLEKEEKSKTKKTKKETLKEEKEVKEETNEVVQDNFEEKYLRLLADVENIKRRSAQDVLSAKDQGKIEVFRELIEVLDNFDRAKSYDGDKLKEGVDLIHNQLNLKLDTLGLEKVEDNGEFNPDFQQAVMTDFDKKVKDNHILESLQAGYKYKDLLIRPSMVKVNKKESK